MPTLQLTATEVIEGRVVFKLKAIDSKSRFQVLDSRI